MEMKEISLAQLLNDTSGTSYFTVFAKLIGHSQDVILYEGVDDDSYYLLEEIEEELGYEVPSNYLKFLGYLNGGFLLKMELFSLAPKEFVNSLYTRNFLSKIRKEIEIEESDLIIGKFENYVIYIDCLGDGTYTLMDIKNNEKIEFENFEALIGFIFYTIILNGNKKFLEEKERILEMKEKLHNDIVKTEKERKKEKEKRNAKMRAKANSKALKEREKKERKFRK